MLERFRALGSNLERILAENGLIFLAPFMMLGWVRLKSSLTMRLAGLYGLLLLILMSFVFPFAGVNGGIFHSSAALMPVLWCLAPIGVDRTVEWAARKRHWELSRARRLFHPSAVLLAAIFTFGLTAVRVIGSDLTSPHWTWPQISYQSVGRFMADLQAGTEPVAVNNPPGYWVATGTSGIVIPTGGLDSLRGVLDRYRVKWLILDANRPEELHALYDGVEIPAWLTYSGSVSAADGSSIKIYRYLMEEGS